ncbi:glutamate racemase [Virgibacillus sp. MSJ-26]|uniref:glutamate racemase n=1 Tax=Virgibacillus sp. MSJ-26 TaxID=2841522 RepID=UPI001C110002|nr:glutamate racemase [Virgibacillus sp. MSJ-26]MBU5466547.1 glutamate racemase [Virgibacillus sp. MSJ-26]
MNQAIGVIDSGVGGLTVASELMRQLPKEQLIYLGDTLRCPYGPRSEMEIRKFTWEMVNFLLEKQIKILVVACNTATAYTLSELHEELDIPVIGVIQPGARAAINVTENNQVGIIGTEATIKSEAYSRALNTIKEDIKSISHACPSLVPLVEKGILKGDVAYNVVGKSLESINDKKLGLDTLILGCTHYPLLKQVIQDVLGHDIKIISSSEETARETSTVLEMNDLLNKEEGIPTHLIYTTGELDNFKHLMNDVFKHHLGDIKNIKIEKAVL